MTISYLSFRKGSQESNILQEWWASLQKNRGERAELRRCPSLVEVTLSPAFHRLRHAVEVCGKTNYDSLALVAALAARVRSSPDGATIAEQMASGKQDGSARVSGLRFRRLLKVREKEQLLALMMRVVALLGEAVNLQSLAEGVYSWNDQTRKNWAFQYYSKNPKAE